MNLEAFHKKKSELRYLLAHLPYWNCMHYVALGREYNLEDQGNGSTYKCTVNLEARLHFRGVPLWQECSAQSFLHQLDRLLRGRWPLSPSPPFCIAMHIFPMHSLCHPTATIDTTMR